MMNSEGRVSENTSWQWPSLPIIMRNLIYNYWGLRDHISCFQNPLCHHQLQTKSWRQASHNTGRNELSILQAPNVILHLIHFNVPQYSSTATTAKVASCSVNETAQTTYNDTLRWKSSKRRNLINTGLFKSPPGFPNSTAQQPRQTRQKGAYQ